MGELEHKDSRELQPAKLQSKRICAWHISRQKYEPFQYSVS